MIHVHVAQVRNTNSAVEKTNKLYIILGKNTYDFGHGCFFKIKIVLYILKGVC